MSAIIHVDGDSFFVACEVLSRPDLRGKPVITGGERGIASAMNIEAKKLGVTRGMPVWQIKRDLPQVVILPSNFSLYTLYNARMLAIARRFSDVVEDYSIDECFIDITDIGDTWEDKVRIAQEIKDTLKRELGLTFSLGLAPTKVLAKVASKNRKPDGFTAMEESDIDTFLKTLNVEDVWGIGRRMKEHFNDVGIYTAHDFIMKDKEWITKRFAVPYQTLWHELHGESLMPVSMYHDRQKSIESTRMFPVNSDDKAYVFSHLSRNIEIACGRLRGMGLYTRKVSIFIKDTNLKRHYVDIDLVDYTNYSADIVEQVHGPFSILFATNLYKIKKIKYKASGITCHAIVAKEDMSQSLFGDPFTKDGLYEMIDSITDKHGDYALVLASSMNAVKSYQKDKTKVVLRKKTLGVPYMGEVG